MTIASARSSQPTRGKVMIATTSASPESHHPAMDRLAWVKDLSAREREVLTWVATGVDDKSIAFRMRVSHRTVRAHLSSLFRKLRVRNRTEVALAGQLSHLLTCEVCAGRLARTAHVSVCAKEAP